MINEKLENQPTLMLEFRSGNAWAFDSVFRALYQPLCLFAFRIVEDQCQAEDLVQDVFVKSWNLRVRFKDFGKLKSFLYMSLKNACFDALDKRKVTQKHQKSLSEQAFVDDRTILEEIIRSEVVGRIFASVDTLPPNCRRIIRHIFEEGKSPNEIAKELNISVSTVNSQKMRGLLLLKARLFSQDALLFLAFLSILNRFASIF